METTLKTTFLSFLLAIASLGVPAAAQDDPVEYVKVCSLYGSSFHYIPGTDICVNDQTGQTREQTEGGTWYSVLPTNNQGHWVTSPQLDCAGRLVQVGTYHPSDFKLNMHYRFQASPFNFKLQPGEFISKVMMSGGFYDPTQPNAHDPQLSANQFCLRVVDPNFYQIDNGGSSIYPYFCTVSPLGCVSNPQILGTPATYSFPVYGTPVVHYNTNLNGVVMGAPMTCGSQLLVTTGMGTYNPTVVDPTVSPTVSTAGTLTVWACVQPF